MWKSREMSDRGRDCKISPLVGKRRGNVGKWRNLFFSWFIHRKTGNNPQQIVEKPVLTSLGDIVLNIAKGVAKFGLIFYEAFYFVYGAQNRGVIHAPAAFSPVLLADFHKGEVCELAD